MSEWKREYRAIPFGKNGEIRLVQQTFSGSDTGLTGDEIIILALADEIDDLKAILKTCEEFYSEAEDECADFSGQLRKDK